MRRRRKYLPPRKVCGECGTSFYGYGDFCSRRVCVEARTAPQAESIGDFRRRVLDPDRNEP